MKVNATQFRHPMEQIRVVAEDEWSMHIVKWSFIRLNFVHTQHKPPLYYMHKCVTQKRPYDFCKNIKFYFKQQIKCYESFLFFSKAATPFTIHHSPYLRICIMRGKNNWHRKNDKLTNTKPNEMNVRRVRKTRTNTIHSSLCVRSFFHSRFVRKYDNIYNGNNENDVKNE